MSPKESLLAIFNETCELISRKYVFQPGMIFQVYQKNFNCFGYTPLFLPEKSDLKI